MTTELLSPEGEIADASDEWLKPQLRLRALLACVPQDRRPDLSGLARKFFDVSAA